jgi:hypothetical protein
VAVPPIAELLPAAVLFVAIVLEVPPIPVVEVLVSPAVGVALVSVVLPEIVLELVPAAPVPETLLEPVVVVAEALKNANEGCSHVVVVMFGNVARVKLGACINLACSTATVNVGGAMATPAVAAVSVGRTRVNGTGIIRPEVDATRAASAQPTGLKTMFSMRPTGAPAISTTVAPEATGTTIGEVVVVVTVVDRVAGATVAGVKGACANAPVATTASPVAQSADFICVLFMSNTFLLFLICRCLPISPLKT